MTSQFQQKQSKVLAECMDSINSWRQSINEYLNPKEKLEEVEKMKEIVKDYCSIDFTSKKSLLAMEEVRKLFDDDNANNELSSKSIEELYQEKLLEQNNKSPEFDYTDHKIWKDIFHTSHHDDVKEVKKNQPRVEDMEFEQVDDSLLCCSVFTPPKDPISQTIIKEPYKSSVCGHVFEYKFIVQYIKKMKSKAKCPYRGCSNNKLSVGELSEDSSLKDKIEEYLRKNNPSHDSSESSEEEESD